MCAYPKVGFGTQNYGLFCQIFASQISWEARNFPKKVCSIAVLNQGSRLWQDGIKLVTFLVCFSYGSKCHQPTFTFVLSCTNGISVLNRKPSCIPRIRPDSKQKTRYFGYPTRLLSNRTPLLVTNWIFSLSLSEKHA